MQGLNLRCCISGEGKVSQFSDAKIAGRSSMFAYE
jgi:hypothetical protein